MKQTIDITPEELRLIQEILKKFVPEYEVRAYGSRVTGRAKNTSDLDIVIMTDYPLDTMLYIDLKEELSESDLPFKVDITDWAKTSDTFKKIIDENSIVIFP